MDIYFIYKELYIPDIGFLHPNYKHIPPDIKLDLFFLPEFGLNIGKCKDPNSLFIINEFIVKIISEEIFEGIKLTYKNNHIKFKEDYPDRTNPLRILDAEIIYEELTKEEKKLQEKGKEVLNQLYTTIIYQKQIGEIVDNIQKQIDLICEKIQDSELINEINKLKNSIKYINNIKEVIEYESRNSKEGK